MRGALEGHRVHAVLGRYNQIKKIRSASECSNNTIKEDKNHRQTKDSQVL
jgi:hypothetical protein